MSRCNRYDETCECSECTADLRDFVSHNAGLYVGQLNDDEMRMFNESVRRGLAYRQYAGAAGFMGLAKIAAR